MLERKEHKKMYKSGKNWAVVTLSTAALVFGKNLQNFEYNLKKRPLKLSCNKVLDDT